MREALRELLAAAERLVKTVICEVIIILFGRGGPPPGAPCPTR